MSGDARDLLEHAPVAVRWVRVDGSIAWANQAELALFLRDARAHVKLREEELFLERDAYQTMREELRAGRSVEARLMQVDRGDGGAFDVLISAVPLNHEGWLTYTVPRGLDRRAFDRIQRMQAAALAI